MLITVYFSEKNKDLDYTKCIIDDNKLDFFIELGAVKTQEEAEILSNVIEIPIEFKPEELETPKKKLGRPKLNK